MLDMFTCVRWEGLVVVHYISCFRLWLAFFSKFHLLNWEMDLYLLWEGFQSAGFQILLLAECWKSNEPYFYFFRVFLWNICVTSNKKTNKDVFMHMLEFCLCFVDDKGLKFWVFYWQFIVCVVFSSLLLKCRRGRVSCSFGNWLIRPDPCWVSLVIDIYQIMLLPDS